jgi:hypothetical protein
MNMSRNTFFRCTVMTFVIAAAAACTSETGFDLTFDPQGTVSQVE